MGSELFSADQMEQHGTTLAGWHKLTVDGAADQLLDRLATNEDVLTHTCNMLTATVRDNRQIPPAGEWLLDNFYLIEDQILTAKKHLPKGYSRELPRLLNGPSAGLPRVYDIALETISHGDGRVEPESLSRFVTAYQLIKELNLGELWAIPIMLRLALIENLRRVATRIAETGIDRALAATWADRMLDTAENDPKSLILVIADMARSNPPLVSSFIAELSRKLQGHGPTLALPLTWIEQRLSENGLTIEQLVRAEVQQQAIDQVSISNSIASLRFLAAMDWRDFVESQSQVEQTLREDPAGVYSKMEFATRDSYRHAVERMSKKTSLTEGQLARKVVQLAHENELKLGSEDRASHVGYYLIGRGRPLLEEAGEIKSAFFESFVTMISRRPLLLYLGSILVLTVSLSVGLVAMPYRDRNLSGNGSDWLLILVGITCLLAVSQFAVALVNWMSMLLTVPKPLPRIDFSEGLPSQARTLVVIPTMLTSSQNIDELLEALEVRFLGNRDQHLYFGLLTDFRDASESIMPADEALLKTVSEGINSLNDKYRTESHDSFFLFHRPRLWNASEQVWMGYERKRGKLADLNMLLRGEANNFSVVVGDTDILLGVRYVITLDTDTQLPRDAARQFVGAMEHPLNRPRYDENKRLIVEGYGILQPLVAVNLPGSSSSAYAQLNSRNSGVDPYTRTVSDVYQDLFLEGSFIGKGIYDVDAFEFTLKNRFPENRILSHDLLEGCYARSGLLSDVLLYEDAPSTFSADATRRYRWIRGDWQLLSWLFPNVPLCDRVRERNPLSPLARWKIADNLRRSLVPIALTILLIMGWTILSRPGFWSLVVVWNVVIPPLLSAIVEVFRKSDEAPFGEHLSLVWQATMVQLAQSTLSLACLPYEACSNLHAIVVTNWRMFVSGKNLLSWTASSSIDLRKGTGLFESYRIMLSAPLIAISAIIAIELCSPAALTAALPILLLWLASPAIVYWLSRPLPRRRPHLDSNQTRFLREAARKTWVFFETFVTEDDNWLPPDNYQERPVERTAHRTSPTNIGLCLLANLGAYDFGYIVGGQLIKRTADTLATVAELERCRGHFYNWYDTQTLEPLLPMYISTVDSGNLAGHLFTLRRGLLALPDDDILAEQCFDGLNDAVSLLVTAAGANVPGRLRRLQEDIQSACQPRSVSLISLRTNLEHLASSSALLVTEFDPAGNAEAVFWSKTVANQCSAALEELTFLAPWLLHSTEFGTVAALLAKSAGSTEGSDGQDGIGSGEQNGVRNSVPEIEQTDVEKSLEENRSDPGPVGAIDAADSRRSATLDLLLELDRIPTLRELARVGDVSARLAGLSLPDSTPEVEQSLDLLRSMIALAEKRSQTRIVEIERLAAQSGDFATMDYDFLFDKVRRLLSIGYNVAERRLDASYYDLLASEARLANFVGIAQGQLPQESWFSLGRLLASAGGHPVLFSWSGSMFEYLMPLLVMPTYEGTLLDQTCRSAVRRQIEYGRQRDVPWGISESGFNAVDVHLNYQYRAFGVPGLGLKRGLAEDLVIAPYATMMALMVAPEAACFNLEKLASEGFLGKFGFYEAIDYTAARVARGQPHSIVRSYMSHHQGMAFLSLAYALLDRPMQKRFESEPTFQSTILLLQERIPKSTVFHVQTAEISSMSTTLVGGEAPVRLFTSPDTITPEVQLLSNGRYHVMVTNAGGGYSRWNDIAVTRFREDATMDNCGTFCYIRDLTSSEFWSAAYQPTLKTTEIDEAIFSESRVEFRRRGFDCDTHSEIVVSSEDDIELRRVRITNRSLAHRTIDVTSYAEVVLAPTLADALHPAFSKLFVQTEIIADRQAILCNRRPRSADEQTPWMFHLMTVYGAGIEEISHETDRSRFIGRGRSIVQPEAMMKSGPLSGTDGSVLDPIVATRYRLTLEPESSATINIVTGIGATRDVCIGLIEKYNDRGLADRVFDLARIVDQVRRIISEVAGLPEHRA